MAVRLLRRVLAVSGLALFSLVSGGLGTITRYEREEVPCGSHGGVDGLGFSVELPLVDSSLVAVGDGLVARGSNLGLVGRNIDHCRRIGFAGDLRNATLWD